jgi:hypothetical protein
VIKAAVARLHGMALIADDHHRLGLAKSAASAVQAVVKTSKKTAIRMIDELSFCRAAIARLDVHAAARCLKLKHLFCVSMFAPGRLIDDNPIAGAG